MSADNLAVVPAGEAGEEISPKLEVVSPEAGNDVRYFYLSAPINVDGKEIKWLLLDPKGVLTGKDLFELLRTYQRKFPEDSRVTFNKFTSEVFLSLVVAKLNKITPEDLYKMHYEDLPLMFLQAASFQFSGGKSAKTE
jgi:hypothetical protein